MLRHEQFLPENWSRIEKEVQSIIVKQPSGRLAFGQPSTWLAQWVQLHPAAGPLALWRHPLGELEVQSLDNVLIYLPTPDEGSTVQMLMERWCSSMHIHPAKRVDADRWMAESGAGARDAMRLRGHILKDELVPNYAENLAVEKLETIALGSGVFMEGLMTAEERRTRLRRYAEASADAFLAGDWNCVTLLGAALLGNAFEASERKPDDSDELLKKLFQTVCDLRDSLEAMYRPTTLSYAIEMNEHGVPPRWHAFLKHDNLRRWRHVAFFAGKMVVMQRRAAERVYAPAGEGAKRCREEFEENAAKLARA